MEENLNENTEFQKKGIERLIQNDIEQNAPVAAVSYIPPLGLICILFRKESSFIRFHAKQGFVLMCLGIIAWFIPGWIRIVLELVIASGIFVGFFKASTGQRYDLPVVDQILHWHLHVKSKVKSRKSKVDLD